MDVLDMTTIVACKVAGLKRDSFNKFVANGYLECVPSGSVGRTRMFTHDDVLVLRLFRDLMDEGMTAERAGPIACAVALTANSDEHRDEPVIAYVHTYMGGGLAMAPSQVPAFKDWGEPLNGSDIRKVSLFRIDKLRALIEDYAREERVEAYFER